MKAIGLSLLVCVLVPVVALAQEGKADLNTITSVTVRGGTVEIVGTKKPNFTTFTMTDPPRLVIDISEAVFSGVKEDQAVGNGTISGIRTASYGSDESSIARVLIGYEREVETDIQATGNSLVVNVQGGGGAAVAARPTAPTGTAPTGTAPAGTAPAGTGTTPGGNAEQATVAARTDQQQQERAAADATAAAQVDRQAQERAAANATAAAQVDRQAQERAAADAAAAARADAEARKQAEARAAAD
ncbi:MAG TPA: AMIN domain-containing protein, partial [Archangium sp.]|nr:AMIN domain-containing protein [Archangium sp.]